MFPGPRVSINNKIDNYECKMIINYHCEGNNHVIIYLKFQGNPFNDD